MCDLTNPTREINKTPSYREVLAVLGVDGLSESERLAWLEDEQ